MVDDSCAYTRGLTLMLSDSFREREPSFAGLTTSLPTTLVGQVEPLVRCVSVCPDNIFGRPFVCHQTVVCPVCPFLSVTLRYCGQTVGRIKMKLGMQVGLGPGHIVLDGNPGPPPQRCTIFGAYLFWPNGSMNQDATW